MSFSKTTRKVFSNRPKVATGPIITFCLMLLAAFYNATSAHAGSYVVSYSGGKTTRTGPNAGPDQPYDVGPDDFYGGIR